MPRAPRRRPTNEEGLGPGSGGFESMSASLFSFFSTGLPSTGLSSDLLEEELLSFAPLPAMPLWLPLVPLVRGSRSSEVVPEPLCRAASTACLGDVKGSASVIWLPTMHVAPG